MNIVHAVEQLNLPADQYVVFGSGPLMVHGIRKSEDVDLFVTAELYEVLASSPDWRVEVKEDGSEHLVNGVYDVYAVWRANEYNPRVEDVIASADVIDGVRFASLQEVLKWKKAFGRAKDLRDIELINQYLSSLKSI